MGVLGQKVRKGAVCTVVHLCVSSECDGIVVPHSGDESDLRCNVCAAGYESHGDDVVATGVWHEPRVRLKYQDGTPLTNRPFGEA